MLPFFLHKIQYFFSSKAIDGLFYYYKLLKCLKNLIVALFFASTAFYTLMNNNVCCNFLLGLILAFLETGLLIIVCLRFPAVL